jgi:hypothetical protein
VHDSNRLTSPTTLAQQMPLANVAFCSSIVINPTVLSFPSSLWQQCLGRREGGRLQHCAGSARHRGPLPSPRHWGCLRSAGHLAQVPSDTWGRQTA